jgi:hypothetical protein
MNVEVKEDEMGKARCLLGGGEKNACRIWWERDHWEDLDIGGRIILK